MTTDNRRNEDKWHIAKDIPVALIIALLVQTAGGVWWAAGVTRDIEYMKQTVAHMTAEIATMTANRYTSGDWARDSASMNARITSNEERIRDLERRRGRL